MSPARTQLACLRAAFEPIRHFAPRPGIFAHLIPDDVRANVARTRSTIRKAA